MKNNGNVEAVRKAANHQGLLKANSKNLITSRNLDEVARFEIEGKIFRKTETQNNSSNH